jgi:hypothetical protein
LLAVAGFVLVILWFIKTMTQMYHQMVGGMLPQPSGGWFGKAGALAFAASWLWALVTSLQILRAAKPDEPPAVPPRLNP